jgi:hypothetical protein
VSEGVCDAPTFMEYVHDGGADLPATLKVAATPCTERKLAGRVDSPSRAQIAPPRWLYTPAGVPWR